MSGRGTWDGWSGWEERSDGWQDTRSRGNEDWREGWHDDRSRGNEWQGWQEWRDGRQDDRSRGNEDRREGWHDDRSRGNEECPGNDRQDDRSHGHAEAIAAASPAVAADQASQHVAPTPTLSQSLAQNDQAAVAEVFDLRYFQNLESTCHWKDHNIALKWFRDISERDGLSQAVFSNTHAEQVPQIRHPKGMSYEFDEGGQRRPWTWQGMVAQMDDESMLQVVQGPEDRSRGLTSCRLQQSEKYDHKRHHAQGAGSQMLKVWDFVLTRDDGSCVSLHPNFSSTKNGM